MLAKLVHGIIKRGPALSMDKAREMISCGYRFIMPGSDTLLLNRGASLAFAGARR